jgi:hypothetical protein
MVFEFLIDFATWIFIVLIPLALLVVFLSPEPEFKPPPAKLSADRDNETMKSHPHKMNAESPPSQERQVSRDRDHGPRLAAVALPASAAEPRAILLGYLDQFADEEAPPSSSPEPSPSRNQTRRPSSSATAMPSVPLPSPSPPHLSLPYSPTPSFRRTNAINTHIDALKAQRHTRPVFDDNSDFDFRPGVEEEYWSSEEGQAALTESEDDGEGYHQCHAEAHDISRIIPTRRCPKGSVDSSPAADPTILTSGTHPNAMMASVLTLISQEAAANQKGKGKAKRTPPPLPWRRSPPPMRRSTRPDPPPVSYRSDEDSSDAPSATRPHRSQAPSPSSSEASEDPASNITASRRASISTHIDALMAQQGIQATNWAHVDMPFERSSGEHQHQEVDCQVKDGYGEDGGEVDEGRDVYSYLHTSSPQSFPDPPPPQHATPARIYDEYTNPRSPASRSRSRAEEYHFAVDEAWAPTLNTSNSRGSVILPYATRYDVERMFLATPVESAPISATASTAPADASFEAPQQQPRKRKRVRFSQPLSPLRSLSRPRLQWPIPTPLQVSSRTCTAPLPLPPPHSPIPSTTDPVFGSSALPAVSPSVRRQVLMRAGEPVGPPDFHDGNEQDWSEDEYRYGGIAGDWTDFPSGKGT